MMKMFNLFALSLASLALAACSDTQKADKSATIEGHWVAPAYGMALTIESSQFRYYQYTSQTCQTLDNLFDETYEQLVDDVELTTDDQQLLNSFFGVKFPAVAFTRQARLPESCYSSLVANFNEPGYTDNALRDFDIFWQNFNDHYAFFELKQVDWAEQRKLWRPRVSEDTTDDELLHILAQMIEPLADGHVEVASADGEEDYEFGAKPTFYDVIESEYEQLPPEAGIRIDDYFEEQYSLSLEIISDAFADDAAIGQHDSEITAWSVLPGNIGYINLFAMAGFSDSKFAGDQIEAIDYMFDEIFSDLASVESMIIDLRFNGGGDDASSARIAGRFTENRTLAWQKQARLGDGRLPLSAAFIEPSMRTRFLKPVVLLTSSTTASAAEVFVLAMQAVTDVKLVGESTQGIFSDTLPKSLPNGISFTLSTEYYLSADGQFYEGQGVPVDVEAPFFTLADRQSRQDTGLIVAQELLKNH